MLTVNTKERYCSFMDFEHKVDSILGSSEGEASQGILFVGANQEQWLLICEHIKEKLEISQFDTILIAEPPKVGELRSSLSRVHYYPMHGKQSALFLLDVDLWSADTLNTMLKLIEEPPKFLRVFLFAKKTSGILPTILSRIQTVALKSASQSEGIIGLTELKKMTLVESLAEIKNLSSQRKALEVLNYWLTEADSAEAQIIAEGLQLAGNQPINHRLLIETLFFKLKFNTNQ